MLISRVHCIVSVYTTRGGQRKSSKHIINFWQNIDRVAQELPLQPGTDDVPLLLRRSSNDGTKQISERRLSRLPDEKKEFDDTIILYTRNKEVDEKNIQMLEATRNPVARLEAQ